MKLRNKYYFIFAALCLVTVKSYSQNITWSNDIACIIYSHCSSCHNNQNSLVAFPLSSYKETFDERNAIQYYTGYKFMPPYQPEISHQRYVGEKTLSDQEIQLISTWVNAGCPRGDSLTEPPSPVIAPLTGKMKSPDLSLKMPDYLIPDVHVNFRRCFILGQLITEKHVREIEVVPGNMSAIYAVYVYSDTSSIPVKLDSSDSGPGYKNFGGTGSSSAKPLYGWVHGSTPIKFPDEFILKIDSGSRIIIQIEYAEDAGNKIDSTRLNIKYDVSTALREIQCDALLNDSSDLLNGPLVIPHDSVLEFQEEREITADLTLFSVSPILHHLCTDFRVYALTPSKDTLYIIEENMHGEIWSEGTYFFKRPICLKKGSKLHASAHYDNTLSNGNNPNNPLVTTSRGFTEFDEEMLFNFQFTSYQVGDEMILLDSTDHFQHYQNCKPLDSVTTFVSTLRENRTIKIYPNPTTSQIFIEINNDMIDTYRYRITDMLGKEQNPSNLYLDGSNSIDVTGYSAGVYLLNIFNSNNNFHTKFIKQ